MIRKKPIHAEMAKGNTALCGLAEIKEVSGWRSYKNSGSVSTTGCGNRARPLRWFVRVSGR